MNASNLLKWVGDIVSSVHKEAALVVAFLASFGVTPGNAQTHKWEAGIFAAYAALGHLSASLAAKSAAPKPAP